MGLTRVTITGADTRTPIKELIALSDAYPFLEVGILMSMKQQGNPRFPSMSWLNQFYSDWGSRPYAWHLCGEYSRKAMADANGWNIFRPQRVQLNGFPGAGPLNINTLASRNFTTEFILQVRKDVHHNVARACRLHLGNVTALNDVSGGTGKPADLKRVIGMKTGFAGGIGPDNVVEMIEGCLNATTDDFWIDMESGVRDGTDDDMFVIEKAARVLELAAPFVTEQRKE